MTGNKKMKFEKPPSSELKGQGHPNPTPLMDTNGNCFLCLDNLESGSGPEDMSPPLIQAPCPFQYLSSYLKLDRATTSTTGSGIGTGGPATKHLSSSAPNQEKQGSEATATWAVLLCEECSRVNQLFVRVLGQLRQIELEMANCLQRIHRKLERAEELDMDEVFRKSVPVKESGSSNPKFVMDLRNEAIQKCSRKVCELLADVHQDPGSADEGYEGVGPCRSRMPASAAGRRFHSLTNPEDRESDIIIKTEPPNETVYEDESYQKSELHGGSDYGDDDPLSDMESEILSNSRIGPEVDRDGVDHQYNDNVTPEPEAEPGFEKTDSLDGPNETAATTPVNKKGRRGRPPRKVQTGMYKCKICGKELVNAYGLKLHHQGVHLKTNKMKPCQLCDKAFKHKTSLNAHRKKAHEGVRYNCPKCKKTFVSQSHLKRHKVRVKCSEQIRRCHLCPEEFTCTTGLRLHLKSAHSTVLRDLVCHLCGKEFDMPYLLDGHMKVVHLNILEHICDHCGKGFTSSNGLRIHVRNIHLAERKTVFECGTCGKKFPRSCHLSRHQRKYHSGGGGAGPTQKEFSDR